MFLMCEDVDTSVCETAIEMMSRLYDRKLLTDVELAAVSELIFAVNKTISTAVGLRIAREDDFILRRLPSCCGKISKAKLLASTRASRMRTRRKN